MPNARKALLAFLAVAAVGPVRCFAGDLPTWVPEKQGWGAWDEINFQDENKVPHTVWCRYSDCWGNRHPATAQLFVFDRISQTPFPVKYDRGGSGTAYLTTFKTKLSHFSVVFKNGTGSIVRDDGKFSMALKDAYTPASMTATGSVVMVLPPETHADDGVKPAAPAPKPPPKIVRKPRPQPKKPAAEPKKPVVETKKPAEPEPTKPAQVSGTASEPKPVVTEPKPTVVSKDALPDALSDDEQKLLNKDEALQYARRMAAAKLEKDPDRKPDDQSRESIVAEYREMIAPRDPKLNLKPEELAAFGDSAAKIKANIDAAKGDARKAMVEGYRRNAVALLAKKTSSRFAKTQDLLDHLADHPDDLNIAYDGNPNTGTVLGAGDDKKKKDDKEISKEEQDKLDAEAKQRAQRAGSHKTDVPPTKDQKVGESDDGGATWKKDLPNIANGVRWGIWAGVIGMFLAGPMGIALFAVAGGLAGYGMSKVSRSLDS
ncbi:MAG: hypothetical protein HY077_06080 [Elusimicrobia bacterium]|nr:hypothetical protein [Elusimicrobiota bacterium]